MVFANSRALPSRTGTSEPSISMIRLVIPKAYSVARRCSTVLIFIPSIPMVVAKDVSITKGSLALTGTPLSVL